MYCEPAEGGILPSLILPGTHIEELYITHLAIEYGTIDWPPNVVIAQKLAQNQIMILKGLLSIV